LCLLNLCLEILYRDEYLAAVNKPHGLAVHRSPYVGDADNYALQLLRDQLGMLVYPCHRLDRKTGGILLFALREKINGLVQNQFAANQVSKKYLAIVRGYTDITGMINYPLTDNMGKKQDAETQYKMLKKSEIPFPSGKFNTSRYSLVEVSPHNGRMHQIRKHFAHIKHTVIGDLRYGCNKQNRFFKQQYNLTIMMLHATELTFQHPVSGEKIKIQSGLHPEFRQILKFLNLEPENQE